jgi:hypothetical protein
LAGAQRSVPGIAAGQGIEFVGDVIYVPSDTTDFTPYLQQVLILARMF